LAEVPGGVQLFPKGNGGGVCGRRGGEGHPGPPRPAARSHRRRPPEEKGVLLSFVKNSDLRSMLLRKKSMLTQVLTTEPGREFGWGGLK
jgi:hypothetical protein